MTDKHIFRIVLKDCDDQSDIEVLYEKYINVTSEEILLIKKEIQNKIDSYIKQTIDIDDLYTEIDNLLRENVIKVEKTVWEI